MKTRSWTKHAVPASPRQAVQVKFAWLVVFGLLVFALLVACSPPTPTPATTATVVVPTAQATANFKATEASIIAHVFATMTAAAPVPTKAAPVAPPAPPTPTVKPTVAAKPKTVATPAKTAIPGPVAPKATTDPYLAQIPKGMGGVLVINYYGVDASFSIAGTMYIVPANSRKVIVVAPGQYNFSAQVPGSGGGGWSEPITIPQDQYVTWQIPITP